MVIVLCKFDQRALPDWPLRPMLNTFLAFFSLLTKAAFMIPVSAAISSSQWLYFLQYRPLCEFYPFDQASRGAWGSLALLWKVKHRHLTSIGAFITIISTLTSPITQLAIRHPLRNVEVPGEAITSAIKSLKRATARARLRKKGCLMVLSWIQLLLSWGL